MTDRKSVQHPFANRLARLSDKLAQMDEPTARELLQDMTDHVRASLSEYKSKGEPDKSLKRVALDLGLDGSI